MKTEKYDSIISLNDRTNPAALHIYICVLDILIIYTYNKTVTGPFLGMKYFLNIFFKFKTEIL